MARYPGSQFIVIDNSATTATVPIATKNPAAPTYLTTFASVKGPEEIRTVSGQEFFDLYGSQDTILFSKYGQPLLQAAMNINTGAQLICKRAVLDSATLANATFGVEVSRELLANQNVIVEEKDSYGGGFKSLTIKSEMLTYDKNENKWFVDSKKFPIIFRPVVYSIKGTSYNDYPSAVNTIINDIINNTNGKSVVNTTTNTTTFEKGILNGIINPTLVSPTELPISSKEGETLLPHGFIDDILQAITTPKFDINNHKRISIDEIIEKLGKNSVICSYTNDNDISTLSQIKIEDPSDFDIFRTILAEYFITSKVYPLFTIFDNGRGESNKSISIKQDVITSKTISKIIYTLSVVDYKTNKVLEKFSFSIDPYVRNSNGHTLDIETSINYKSNQIKAKMHYDSYDKLIEDLQINGINENILSTYDCLFGHDLYGKTTKEIQTNTFYVFSNRNKNNLDKINSDSNLAYYYYDYDNKYINNISEKLYFGSNGEETTSDSYNIKYKEFFNGTFSKDVFNLDVYFPNCIFDANYDNPTKLAIQKLAAFRGDVLAYVDMGTDTANNDIKTIIDLIPDNNITNTNKNYIRDMHVAVTCISYDIKDPYTNKQIKVTGTYGLSLNMVNHYITGIGKLFAGKNNGIIFTNAIKETVNYIPKIYPGENASIPVDINGYYPSDYQTIINEKQIMNDSRINYGSYYEDVFTMDTQYTLNETESEFSYINNVMLVNNLIQDIRKACPSARYNFIDGEDLEKYKKAVTTVINAHRSKFALVEFKYLKDENSIDNKIFYAALEVTFRPFAQAEIFTITALNYSTLDSNVTTA